MQETSKSSASTPNSVHPEIRSLVQLNAAHRRKIYYSGPLIRKMEFQPDGQKHKDDGWVEIWAQLCGTILSIWDMKETREASKQGKEVPPSFVNVTDAVRIFRR
jgi:CCR4-NOT transcriptional complex subunit CAF120